MVLAISGARQARFKIRRAWLDFRVFPAARPALSFQANAGFNFFCTPIGLAAGGIVEFWMRRQGPTHINCSCMKFIPRIGLVLALGLCASARVVPQETDTPASPPSSSEVHLTAPLPIPRASFFHAALEVPPLEPARTLAPGTLLVELETAHVRSVERRTIDGVESRFDGLFHDWGTLKLSAGLFDGLEVFGRASLSGWDEKLDKFFLLDGAGNPIVENESGVVSQTSASHRHDNVSDAVVGLKGLFLRREDFPFDLAGLCSLKIPVARPTDLTNAGTYDLNFGLLASVPLGPVTIHANGGVGIPLGSQNLFVSDSNADVRPFVHGGLAAAWRLPGDLALVAQIEANYSAFEHVEFLEGPPVTVGVGVRKLFGRFFVEAGGGTGLVPRSSYDYAIHFAMGWMIGAK